MPLSNVLYGLAEETHEVYGHGDQGTEQRICRMGSYGSGEFPPIFLTWDGANEWRKHHDPFGQLKIVELHLCKGVYVANDPNKNEDPA